LQGEL